MSWTNNTLQVFHGTDEASAIAINRVGIDPKRFRSRSDFGAGFYVTTVLHQAQQWANQRCRRGARSVRSAVLRYELNRAALGNLTHLCLTLDDADYYDFVAYCRAGLPNHGPTPRLVPYEVVYGPVSLWPQQLTIADCDQLLFTDPGGTALFHSPATTLLPPQGQRFF